MVRLLRGLAIAIAVLAILVAGAIFVMSDPDVPAAELEAQYGVQPSQFLMLPSGARAHVRDRGPRDAPVLVLIHGSNAALFTWEPWVARLQNDFRVVTMDMPAHGLTGPIPSDDYSLKSMAAFTVEVVTALGIDKFAVAGNSMGAGVATRVALDNPDRVTHLIQVDGGGMPSKLPREPGLGFRIARLPVINQVMRWVSPRNLFEGGLKTAIYDDKIVTPDMVDMYWRLNRREGTRAATLKRFNTPWDTYNADNMSKIAMPTLILWGDKDTLIPPDSGEAARDAIKGSQFVLYKNVGHIPMEEVPDQSAAAVKAFLKGEPVPSLAATAP
jgi:pimeloyl-ACP methyl ester carboxylesterase